MHNETIDELFAQAFQGNYDDDDAWKAVHRLQSIGSRELFEKAAATCRSNEPLKRARGADILAQLGHTSSNPNTLFADESFKILTGMLDSETDPVALSAIVTALGHLKNSSAIPLILPFSYHPDPDVRFGLAFALGCFADDKRSVATLLKLMADKDSEVRDWATFGLGDLSDLDSPEIRDALFQNLSDQNEDVREEAMVGLAKRKDIRSLPAVVKGLKDEEPSRALDAANFLLERTTDLIEDPSVAHEALRQRFHSQI